MTQPAVLELPLKQVIPNPDQPRKRFDPESLSELAQSIKTNGLLQAITVQPLDDGRYMIVAGERRWRAHQIAKLKTIRAEVRAVNDEQRDILAIVENLQRSDISPLEEGRAFQRMIDQGWTAEALALRLGLKQPWRITDRTQLLRLLPEYLTLLERGHLATSQAFELSRLSAGGQRALFTMLREGRCENYSKLRAAADGIQAAEQQGTLFDAPKPTPEEVALLTAFEKKIETVVRLVGYGFKDNEIVALKKIHPGRAALVVSQLGLVRKHLAMIEREIQKVAAQEELIPT